jgi:adenine-specific DNA-methyltransferase
LPNPRELGRVYTPPAIASKIVRACLDRWFDADESVSNGAHSQTCRVLDPACGDGAFLLEVYDELCRRSGEAPCEQADLRLGLVRDHIFGVDIDPPAVETLRARFLERIAATGELAGIAAAVVERNMRCGDSLRGPSLRETVPDTLFVEKTPDPFSIDWRRDFPAAAVAGGFDIIVGNPPYLRERNAKALFDSLAATELGRRWREARMDLWYYFVHRSLDLLRTGGFLSFIVNSYWMSSRGAGRLIERLKRETFIEEMELFDDSRVFKSVAGRHMIFRLRKSGEAPASATQDYRNGDGICRIIVTSNPRRRGRRETDVVAHDPANQEFHVPFSDLFQNGRLVVAPPDPTQDAFRDRRTLGAFYHTRQGMAENPPMINRRLQRRFPDRYEIGEGVFVLRPDEVERLHLTPTERACLRPFYELAACGRYRLAAEPTHSVLYLTRRTAPHLEDLPHIAAHLERFRPILELRRETREGKCAWWHLHWPREEEIFVRPRILNLQMGERPQFAFAERPTFVGFSINLILAGKVAGFALDVLTGILNSDLARSWFARHAKRRGVNLEINAHLLKQFPLPSRNAEIERQVGELVRARQALSVADDNAADVERQIEELVRRLYRAIATRPNACPQGMPGTGIPPAADRR